ncbi:hypothetical protein N0V83_009674 [Neocucurbitaria cava]|uniref:Mitotic checkpoint regulator, MAD2B-interacting-domain-containing protein n=1 Tax=Neocucurbitaria cava TaxID=798079 RepID=A0A9W8Y1A4_9PLEO|nr:hypothetical protein N0V83_009674 [Neocucurbitaria cava]
MNLTAYSDSESDGEAPSAPNPTAKPAPKPAFQKVIDRANPGRIKLNLPGASQPQPDKDDIQDDAPPAKKPRLGGGGLGGLGAMLPTPKKPNASAAIASASTGQKGFGKGLGAGVNLKTGAEPAFKREPQIEAYDHQGNRVKKEPMNKDDFRAMLNLPSKTETKPDTKAALPDEQQKTEPQTVPKPVAPRFVPLSVGKGKKKKPMAARPAVASTEGASATARPTAATQPAVADARPPRKPKVSLFGVAQDEAKSVKGPSEGQYQPLLYGADDGDEAPVPNEAFTAQPAHQNFAQHVSTQPSAAAPNDLSNIASELNLSEAERRQLFGKQGRGGPDFSSAKIVEFNTDTEYAYNEKQRQLGEQIQHNPLKSISGTGKNSLRSLVSAATTQKDALEDHFAASHRNKREAGSKYGW